MAEDKNKASEIFWDSIISAGTGIIDCGFCGRTHFTLDGNYDFERKEAAELLKNHRHNPDRYVQHHGDSLHWGLLDGKQAVYECSCDAVKKYEDIFWRNKHIIAEYFSNRAKKMREQAETAQSLASRVVESIE